MILVSAFTLLWAVLILAVLGLLFGLGLAIAAKGIPRLCRLC